MRGVAKVLGCSPMMAYRYFENKEDVFASLRANRFHRLDESRSKATGGHGLGLAIVRAIAEVHHMTIDLKPGVPRGTRVSFSLPAQHD